MREKQERLEKSEEFRIKQLHFADNEGIMSEEIGSDESYAKLFQRAGGRCKPVQ